MSRLCLPGVDVYAADSYVGDLRALIIRYKERHQVVLAQDLAEILLEPIRLLQWHTGDSIVALVPVPSLRATARARGGNHVYRLANLAARGTDNSVDVVESVSFTRHVRDSMGLSRAERRSNLVGSMAALSPAECGFARAEAVIVDDVVTTGASVIETARALRAAGWRIRGAAVVAATPRQREITANTHSSLP